jgi:hypothetical protein
MTTLDTRQRLSPTRILRLLGLTSAEGANETRLSPARTALPSLPPGTTRSSAIYIHAESFARLDAEAERQQRVFRRDLTTANVCLMFAGVLSGIVLTVVPLLPRTITPEGAPTELLAPGLPGTLGMAALALGACAAFFTYRSRESNRQQRWLTARSGAELARSSFYVAIVDQALSGPDALPVLQFIKTELLDDQRRWYHRRASEHRHSSDWTSAWGGLATALAFLGGSGAVIASFVPTLTWLALCGVVGAAVGAYALNREGLRLDRVNAEGYEKAATALDAIAARYDAVEEEVRAGKAEALKAFTTAVIQQLAIEHKRWLETSIQAQDILNALDAQLERIAGHAKPPPATTHAADAAG